IASCTLFGMSLNYSTSMIAAAAFYLISSVWFLKRREKCVVDRMFYISSIDSMGFPANIGLPEPTAAALAAGERVEELRLETDEMRLRMEALAMENEALRMKIEALELENRALRQKAALPGGSGRGSA
ncbi:MAG: hypothetical protein J5804_04790, partial [Eggerthellaceae bacterium]|nr:hypothetical protein [Eggerthellaceae bacterium]